MAETHYVFFKNGFVDNVLVFSDENDILAQAVADTHGYTSFVFIGEESSPARGATYDANTKTFGEPDLDYLYSIGISPVNKAMAEAMQQAAEEANTGE